MTDTKTVKLYRMVGRDDRNIALTIHQALKMALGQDIFNEYHRLGGRSGDLSEEIAQLTVYSDGKHTAQFYVVTDDNTNGFSVCMSVIVELGDERCVSITKNLRDMLDFVTSHSSFKKRTPGYHAFADYLDEPYVIPRNGPFAVR